VNLNGQLSQAQPQVFADKTVGPGDNNAHGMLVGNWACQLQICNNCVWPQILTVRPANPRKEQTYCLKVTIVFQWRKKLRVHIGFDIKLTTPAILHFHLQMAIRHWYRFNNSIHRTLLLKWFDLLNG
jgi:hypothetical protein